MAPPEAPSASWLLFDEDYYRALNPEVLAPGQDALEHFLSRGGSERRDPSPWFDVGFYLETYPDVADSGLNPLEHYVRYGADEGRDPNPWFVTSFYLARYRDVAASGMNPLLHFARYGSEEGRQPNPWFDAAAYRRRHPTVAVAGADPFLHYLHVGRARGHYIRDEGARPVPGSGPAGLAGRQELDREADEIRKAVAGAGSRPADPRPATSPWTAAPRLVAFYEVPGGATAPGRYRGEAAWRRVLQARPVFEGHDQPRSPAALGPYDPLAPGILAHQMLLARSHGIAAFCFRWDRGGADVVERGSVEGLSGLRFCLFWEGSAGEGARAESSRFWQLLKDDSYLKVDGRPLVLVGGASPTEEARRLSRGGGRAGEPAQLFLVRVGSAPGEAGELGPGRLFEARLEASARDAGVPVPPPGPSTGTPFHGSYLGYRETLVRHLSRPPEGATVWRRVFPGWDDTPARPADGAVCVGATPGAYQAWLELALEQSRERGAGLVFVDGWNRWSRGAVLEPDERWGHAWLRATKRALERVGR